MKLMSKIKKFIIFQLMLCTIFGYSLLYSADFFQNDKIKEESFNIKTNSLNYTNPKVISDGIGGIYWNEGGSVNPDIATDSSGNLHIVWADDSDEIWGTDEEIIYITYSESDGWSVPVSVSDGYNDIYWNNDDSRDPAIAVDKSGNPHVVWWDRTDGVWGNDTEIMYSRYSPDVGWSNATIVSDGFEDKYWNDGDSENPKIAIDSKNTIHIVWEDNTIGPWGGGGGDSEIMYTSYSTTAGWSNVTIISDKFGNNSWNDYYSGDPVIAVDKSNTVHVLWEDETNGIWGYDREIMYISYEEMTGWSNVSIISDGHNNIWWNGGFSFDPAVAIDSIGTIHVVWGDTTYSPSWGGDDEIMYSSYTKTTGWTLPCVISDGYNDNFWNDDDSYAPAIAIDSDNNLHVTWEDETDGPWGIDDEIMYANYTILTGWSNATVISDMYGNNSWNDGYSVNPAIAIGKNHIVHVIWEDYTDGVWGTDSEIMYSSIPIPIIRKGGDGIISFGHFNLLISFIAIIGIIIFIKRKKLL